MAGGLAAGGGARPLRRRGCENLRRRRLRLGNRSYLQQLIEQKSGRWVWRRLRKECAVTLSVVPEGLAAASAAVEALTARLAAAH